MYLEPRALLQQRRALVTRLGTAPDGLPLAMSVNRGTPPERLLIPIARAIGTEQQPEEWVGPLKQLADQVRTLVDSRQFAGLTDNEGREGLFYLSWSNLKKLLGQTVLEELIHPRSFDAVTTPPWNAPRDEPGTFMDTRAVVLSEVHEENLLRNEQMSGLKLGIDLQSDRIAIARIDRGTNRSQAMFVRPFVEECLHVLSSARFCARSGTGSVIEGSFGQEYAETRKQLATQHYQWLMTVERRELIRLCGDLARSLQSFHDRGVVHGDLKPANILLAAQGISPIDSLDVPIGELSTGLSQDYAAPEQIIGDPVQHQTDQYALGILLTKIVNGLLYGEEGRFHIPVSSQRLEVFTLLKNPGIFLSPQTLNAPREALEDLRQLIQRCLHFNPKERYTSMTQLADEIEQFLERHEVAGHVECELRYGNLMLTEDAGLVWMLEDIHP